jgi:hypothetical protein
MHGAGAAAGEGGATCACFMLAQARQPASISQSSTPNAYTSAACAQCSTQLLITSHPYLTAIILHTPCQRGSNTTSCTWWQQAATPSKRRGALRGQAHAGRRAGLC